MKKIIYTTIALFFSHFVFSQVFWTEAFENNCSSGCPGAGVNTGNGPWTVTNNSPALDGCGFPTSPNMWYVSCAENGNAAGVCGTGCGSDESLHVGSTTVGDLGAAYDAGGWCDFGLGGWGDGTPTDIRAESPTINCTPYSTITLSFNYIENGQTTLDNATLWWFDGTSWAQLVDLAKTTLCAGQGLWTNYTTVLPAAANNNPNVKIGFRWVNNDDGTGTDPSFAVDDITLSVVASGNTITTGTITGSPFCACATVDVPFTSTGTFTAGNVYSAELSNATGSFAAPITIGSLASTANSGTISCVIPCNTVTGTQYRIRVVSSSPSVTGSDNGVNITINAAPTAPVIGTITQPTCSVSTGSVALSGLPSSGSWTVTASPGGATLIGSGTTGTFTGLTANTTYTFTVTNASGCTSVASTNAIINAIPSPPAAPTASVTQQPTCATPTGTIVVTAPTGASIEYSIGGAYQASGTFAGLSPNSYNVTAQDISTGCISTATVLVVDPVPSAPATPTASVTQQPTCATPTGTIEVTAPSGASIEYSVGGAYQASGTFAGLIPNTYNVTAQDVSTGCISTATVLVVDPVPSAPTAPTASVTQQPTCATPTGTIVVTAPTGASIEYSVGGAYQASGTFAGLVPNSYNVTAQDISTGCISTATVLVVDPVPSAPAAPTASVTQQPTCITPTGTIEVTAPTGINIEYSVGGAYQVSGTFSGLAANSYNVTAQDVSTGCISSATVLVINAAPGAPATPTATVTQQPSCTTPTGTIVVTAPTGVDIEYSIGGAYQASGTFAGLIPNTYNVTAQDISTGCTSSATVLVVDPVPSAPAAPTASVTQQPTCATPSGTIVVTAPTGASIEYSIGGAYQASGTFASLTPNSYNVTAQDISTGCISTATVLVVDPVPSAPAAPTASVTQQPTCTTPSGTIVVTAPTGASIEYSIGGAYQASGTFAGLTPNSYNVTAQDISTGCISTATVLVVDPVPSAPAAPTASVTQQPTCITPTGTIEVTAPTGINIEYSVGGTYQVSGTFSGLAANSYNVTAQDVSTGCISVATVLVINAAPGAPATPTATVTQQPTCTTPTGTIVVTAPTGVDIEYSIGGAYQASGTFTGLVPNTYNVTAQDISTGCTSSATVLVVDPVPSAPAAPTASVTQQPTCATPTGTIVVTAPSGANIEYSIGGAYQASGTFSGLTPNSYNVTAQDISTGCISTATVLIVDPVPSAPAAPTASVTQQATCTTPTGTIVVTAPTGANIEYSVGGAYQASGTFAGLTPNTYNITAQDISTGCISSATVLVVDAASGSPIIVIDTQTDVSCFGETDGSASVSVSGGTSPYNYAWSPIGGNTDQAIDLPAGTYTVTVTDDVGCISSESITIGSPAQLNINGTETDIICGTSAGSISTNVTGGTSPYVYLWNNSSVGSSINGLSAGNYDVTVTDDNGCESSESYTISSSGSLTVNISPNDTTILLGESIQITSSGGTDYIWSPTAGLSCSDCPNPIASPSITTIYTVEVSDSSGCTGEASILITVDFECGEIFVPTIFSPNGDLNNDKLVIFGMENCVLSYSFVIYNRWGEMVFETILSDEFWDGTYKGKPMNTGIYVYKLVAILGDGTNLEQSGNVTLVR